MNHYVHSLKNLKLKYWTLPCQERFNFGAGDPVVCKTAYFIPVLMHGACAIIRFDLKNNIGIFEVLDILKANCCEKATQVT